MYTNINDVHLYKKTLRNFKTNCEYFVYVQLLEL